MAFGGRMAVMNGCIQKAVKFAEVLPGRQTLRPA
jgi:hypothetical protein